MGTDENKSKLTPQGHARYFIIPDITYDQFQEVIYQIWQLL